MCDTVVVVADGRVLFAKNSDRDANEAQLLEWHPRTHHEPSSPLQCTYLTIPQVEETAAILLSRPFWMWGAEIGANEHGVVIGNEAVFTRGRVEKTGLTGMDLLRLALERADSASRAVEVITELLERHGQGGGCDHETRRLRYHNSYIVADPTTAFVLETAGREWAVEEVHGVRTISNALTIPEFAARHSDWLVTRVACGRTRQTRTATLAGYAAGPADLMHLLRDHGDGSDGPHYDWFNGSLDTVCMHGGGGAVHGSVSTASWVSELAPGSVRHWATGTAAPCCSLFKPVRVEQPLDLGPPPTDSADTKSLWWRHEGLHRAVLRDPAQLLPLFAGERNRLEASWIGEPPTPRDAIAQADRALAEWTDRVAAAPVDDVRPWWARRYWNVRSRRAGLPVKPELRSRQRSMPQ
jgi:dipeptidase